jgi:nitrite reductase/ring-hydroxylating ferredoxin subunit
MQEPEPTERAGWTPVAAIADIPMAKPVAFTVGDAEVMILRLGDQVFATSNRCTHQKAPLNKGVARTTGSLITISCPLHGSTFRLADGRILRGPAITKLPVHEARVSGETLEVRLGPKT